MVGSVKLIATTIIDFNTFIEEFKISEGSSPAELVDEYEPDLGKLAKYVCMLSPVSKPLQALKQATLSLEHIFLGFLISKINDIENELLRNHLSVISFDNIIVASGSLALWKQATINLCSLKTKNREIGNQLLEFFEKSDLYHLFMDYNKNVQPDRTILLQRSP